MFEPEDITLMKMNFGEDMRKMSVAQVNFIIDLQTMIPLIASKYNISIEEIAQVIELESKLINFKLQFDKEQKGENI